MSENHGSGGAPSSGWVIETMLRGAMSGRSPSDLSPDKKRHTKNDAAVANISARNGKENKVNRSPQRSGPESHYNDDQRAHEEEDNEETRKNSSSGLATSKTPAKRSLFFNATTSYNSGSVGISGNTGVHSFHDIKSSVAMKRKTGNEEEAMATGKRMKAPSSKFGGATDQVVSSIMPRCFDDNLSLSSHIIISIVSFYLYSRRHLQPSMSLLQKQQQLQSPRQR